MTFLAMSAFHPLSSAELGLLNPLLTSDLFDMVPVRSGGGTEFRSCCSYSWVRHFSPIMRHPASLLPLSVE